MVKTLVKRNYFTTTEIKRNKEREKKNLEKPLHSMYSCQRKTKRGWTRRRQEEDLSSTQERKKEKNAVINKNVCVSVVEDDDAPKYLLEKR